MIILTRSAAAASLAGALLAACTLASAAPEPPALDGTAWVLSTLPGRALVPASAVTLRFEGARAQGTDGCNRYVAPYTANATALRVGPGAASTRMACQEDLMEQAAAYLGALERASAYRIESGRLDLLSADGTVLAAFAPQQEGLAGTSWSVTGYNNGKQAVVSVLAGTALTMDFSADGRLSGSSGCNHYGAAYTAEGRKIALGAVAVTRKACPSPEGVMEQERLFLAALGTVATASVEGDHLELRTAEDSLAVSLTREPGR